MIGLIMSFFGSPKLKIGAFIVLFIIIIGGSAFATHKILIAKKERTITDLQTNITILQANITDLSVYNESLKLAVDQNAAFIERQKEFLAEQNTRLSNLQASNNVLAKEKDQYLSIFRRHDLQRLSLAKPGLIENRINKGTKDINTELESHSKEFERANENK